MGVVSHSKKISLLNFFKEPFPWFRDREGMPYMKPNFKVLVTSILGNRCEVGLVHPLRLIHILFC